MAHSFATWGLAARPRTLPAAAAPVLLGGAVAWEAGAFHLPAFGCALAGALLIQIGTNYWNDVHDFALGADKHRVGPVRATQAGLVTPGQMRAAALTAFGLAVLAGTYIMLRGGWPIVAIGFSGLFFGWLYTAGRKSLAYLGLADVFVLTYFGPVAVAGTFYAQAVGQPAAVAQWPLAAAVGWGPGFLATAILLANNLRDEVTDRAAGKRTLVVRLGRRFGVALYGLCLAGAAVVPAVLILAGHAPVGAAAALLAFPLAVPPLRTLLRTADPLQVMPVLGQTARLLLVYSVLLSAGWVAG